MYSKSIKCVSLIVIMVLVLNLFIACGNKDDGFKTVVSVTYTIDGNKKTENSTAGMELGIAEPSSENEYNRAESKYQVYPRIRQNLQPSSKTVSSIGLFDNSDKGKFIYYWYFNFNVPVYVKYQIKSDIIYNYIQVKVIDDDTIIIKNSNGETTYNVSSYSIIYFN